MKQDQQRQTPGLAPEVASQHAVGEKGDLGQREVTRQGPAREDVEGHEGGDEIKGGLDEERPAARQVVRQTRLQINTEEQFLAEDREGEHEDQQRQ